MRFKRTLFLIAMLALVFLVAACGGKKEDDTSEKTPRENPELPVQSEDISFTELDRTGLEADKVIASYEGGELKGDEFAQFLAFQGFISPHTPINDPEFRQEALKFLILQKIVSSDVKSQDWAKGQAEEIWEAQFNVYYDDAAKERAYKALQTSEEEIKDSLLLYFLMEDHFRKDITEQQVRDEYENLKEQITTADVRHILIQTHERQADGTMKEVRTDEEAKNIADELYEQLQGGTDFAELAKEKSEDPGSKENGGLYEGYPVANWVPEFKEATLTQEIDEIGQPVKTDYGYHIIRVEDRQVESFEDMEDYLYAQLAGAKVDKYYQETLPEKIKEINL